MRLDQIDTTKAGVASKERCPEASARRWEEPRWFPEQRTHHATAVTRAGRDDGIPAGAGKTRILPTSAQSAPSEDHRGEAQQREPDRRHHSPYDRALS